MERMTLREASERTARSITTLRRYIRSGRLHAEKRDGRFGPEYFVSRQDLAGAGLEDDATGGGPLGGSLVASPRAARSVVPLQLTSQLNRGAAVPLTLYQELQMKHEQLLVQYGMIRAGGLRAPELQNEVQVLKRQLADRTSDLERLRVRTGDEINALKRELRSAHLELQGRALEIAAFKEKVRALEMLTRNSATSEDIEKQYRDVMDQSRRVGQLRPGEKWQAPASRPEPPGSEPPEH